MNNYKFIERFFNDTTKSGMHGNLFVKNETLYSYGYHYPLCKKINGVFYVNNRGYSNTTSKHIAICYSYGAKGVGDISSIENIRTRLLEKIDTIENSMMSKKRTNTKVYRSLVNDRDHYNNILFSI